jgi:hypothetical protein
MATWTPASPTPPPLNPFGVDIGAYPAYPAHPAYTDALARAGEVGDRVWAGVRATGLTALDAYQKAVRTATEVQVRVAATTRIDWVTESVQAQARFVQDLTAAYTKAARVLLS